MTCSAEYSPKAVHVLSVMVFWGQIQNYMMRVNLSILIVAMAREEPTAHGNETEEATVEETCLRQQQALANGTMGLPAAEVAEAGGEFEWDQFTRGLVLSAFSYGYVLTQLLGGRTAELFGVKRVYGLGLLGCALLTLLAPAAARWNTEAFMVLRALQGACEGVTFPALHAMTARWVLPEQRNGFIARSYFGSTFGMIITFPLCGVLVQAYGWDAAFYVIGCLTLVWFCFWWLLVFDSPDSHPRISAEERMRIREALGGDRIGAHKTPIPWGFIFTSAPFYGLIATDICNCWGLYTLATNGPSYIKIMLGLDIAQTGFLASLPMLSRYLGGVILAAIADCILVRRALSVVAVRRIFNSISQCVPAFTMLLLAFSGCDVAAAIALMSVGCFFNGALSAGHFSSYIDLSPAFCGTLFGVGNTFSGGVTGFLVPMVIGAITQNNMTFDAWRTVFMLAAGIYFAGNAVYVVLISGEVQFWNYPEAIAAAVAAEEAEAADGKLAAPSAAVKERGGGGVESTDL